MILLRLLFAASVLIGSANAADVPITVEDSSLPFEWTEVKIKINGTFNRGEITFRGTLANRSGKDWQNVWFCVMGYDASGRTLSDKRHVCLAYPEVWDLKAGATANIERTAEIRMPKFGKGAIQVNRFTLTRVGAREYQAPITNERAFENSCDEVWAASVPLLAGKGFNPQSADRQSGIISLSWVKGESVYPESESDASLLTGASAGKPYLFTAFRMTSGTFTVTPSRGGCRVLMRVTYAAYKTGLLFNAWISLDSNNVLENDILNSLSKALPQSPSGEPEVLSKFGETQSSISITSLPSSGEIELDGAFVGTTPSQLSIRSGEHSVSVKKAGYLLWSRRILVQPDSKISLHAELEKTVSADK